MTPQNGTGPAVLLVTMGTTAEIRWAPQLQVTIDGTPLGAGLISNVELRTKHENPTVATLIFTFMGAPAQMRTAVVSRALSALAPLASGDGIAVTMAPVV